MKISVLRLGHRVSRDKRITTHVCLTARAFSASEVIYSGERDKKLEESVKDVVNRWGGKFEIRYEKNWRKVINKWKGRGIVVNLSMYGLPIQNKINKIRGTDESILVIIGGKKVPGEIYKLADYNISVTQQPHSELSALVLFLDRLFEGKELEKEFKGAKIKVVPQEKGKKVIRE